MTRKTMIHSVYWEDEMVGSVERKCWSGVFRGCVNLDAKCATYPY